MTHPEPGDPVRAAWSRQPEVAGSVDLDRARGNLQRRQAEIKKRDRIGYLTGAIIAPSWAAAMWFMPDLRVVAAVGFVVAVWVTAQTFLRSGARVIPPADGTCVSFQEALLERELQLVLSTPRWRLLPIALSQPLILFVLLTSPRFPRTALLVWGAVAMAGTAAAVLLMARRRLLQQAADLQRELAVLRAATSGDILATTKG
jgi:hypothetical protein